MSDSKPFTTMPAFLVLGLLLIGGAYSKETCEHKRKSYRVGESWLAGDRCNTCSCSSGGLLKCTPYKCRPTPNIANLCMDSMELSKFYWDNPFEDVTGCNTCRCTNKKIVCTKKVCHPKKGKNECRDVQGVIRKSGEKYYDEYCCGSACECVEGKLKCTMGCNLPFKACTDNTGTLRRINEIFEYEDGCNTCRCNEDTTITCKTKPCLPCMDITGEFRPTGKLFYDKSGCNQCECRYGGIRCQFMPCKSLSGRSVSDILG